MRKSIRINMGNIHLKIEIYPFRKNKTEFKIGDRVECRFGNSGHKFYPELKENLIIKRMKYDYYSGFWGLNFGSKHYFCENDFEVLK
jgi:hypothetical protein